MAVRLQVTARSARCPARTGVVQTPHGPFATPAFMPVGTRGTVKGILPGLLAGTGAQICLGNTYHLMLRPGSQTVAALGGLQVFSGWRGPMLTDSGGYQAYSMADLNTINEDGVTFKSVVDGSMVHLSPERAIAVQNQLGADIIMAFDDCPPSADATEARTAAASSGSADGPTVDPRLARVVRRDTKAKQASGAAFSHAQRLTESAERTLRWLQRCKDAHARPSEQALFGIVQGGTDPAMRAWCAERVCNIDLPGYAIGGVAVGETSEQIAAVAKFTAPLLPEHKPRYLMGVGYERDIVAAVLAGVDMFDCVLPTRNGRNANAFTPTGQIRLRNAKFALDRGPIDPGCDCLACAGDGGVLAGRLGAAAPDSAAATGRGFSRGYLRHLFNVEEMLGPILVTLHNLRHFQRLMTDLRATIVNDDWPGFVSRWPVAAPAFAGFPELLAPPPGGGPSGT